MTDLKDMTWQGHQVFERDWWGDCLNTFGEEAKQISYAHRMGLVNIPHKGYWPSYFAKGQKILDIGGGPVSMLLKTLGFSEATVVDPCDYPAWVYERYKTAGITSIKQPGERPVEGSYDECWIYNVLQHVRDPKQIIANARAAARVVRIFEWVGFGSHIGHPHELKVFELNDWLGGQGRTEQMTGENGCYGTAYFGVFGKP